MKQREDRNNMRNHTQNNMRNHMQNNTRNHMQNNTRQIAEFLTENKTPVPDPDKKARDMLLFREVLKEQRISGKKSLWIRIPEQAQFIHPASWLVQLVIAFFGITFLYTHEGEMVFMGIAALVPFLGIAGGYELSRCLYCHMWELERTCRYDSRQNAGIKMFLFGLCDLAVLLLFSGAVYRAGGDLTQIGLYVLIPFNISSGVYLIAMEHISVRNGNLLLFCMGMMMLTLEMIMLKWTQWIAAVKGGAVGAAFIISLFFLAGMTVRYYRNRNWEDRMLWNLK